MECSYMMNKLVSVTLTEESIAEGWEYRERKSFLGVTIQARGYYYVDVMVKPSTEYYTIRNRVVYNRPQVHMQFESDMRKTYYFRTTEQARKFYDNIIIHKKTIDNMGEVRI